jgi:hypothetical protein
MPTRKLNTRIFIAVHLRIFSRALHHGRYTEAAHHAEDLALLWNHREITHQEFLATLHAKFGGLNEVPFLFPGFNLKGLFF